MIELPRETARILVIDDEEMNRKLLSMYLDRLGYKALLAASGREGLDLLDASVDLVLLDVLMPDTDGFEVCRRIREESPARDIPVIMVTALKSKEDRLRAVEAGANDFIAKPIDVAELRIRMGSHFDPKVLDLFFEYPEEILAIQTKYAA